MFTMLKRYLTYWLYLYIRGVGCKIVYVLRVRMVKTRPYPPRIGTAVNVGATRARSAIDPLASISFKIFLTPASPSIFLLHPHPNALLCNTLHSQHHPYERHERALQFGILRYGGMS